MFCKEIPSRLRRLALAAPLVTVLAACGVVDTQTSSPAGNTSPIASGPGEPSLPRADSDAEVADQLARASASLDNALPGSTVGYYLDVQTAKLQALQQQGVQVQRASDHIRLILPGAGSFDTGSATLTAAIQGTLDQLAGLLREYDQSLVLIAGHSDNQGDPAYNLQLSRQRAQSVGLYLNRQGVETQRIVIRGFGDSRPVADNATEEGRSANRRIELELWPLTVANSAVGTS